MKNDEYPIDIVITWVDPNDVEWQKTRDKYIPPLERKNKSTAGDERFDDNGLLKYIFRGIEQFASWVNKIHFVTCGHLPKWLNTNHPKLHLVKHSDFIDDCFLPTFNAHPLGINLYKIPGLSEHFIYVNDDMYFVSPTKKEVFFKKGLPCDMAVFDTIECSCYQDTYLYSLVNDMSLLNKIADKKQGFLKHPFKWFNCKYGLKNNIKNMCLLPFNLYTNIYEPHTPAAYLKSTFTDVAHLLKSEFDSTTKNKVRSPYDCTENVVRFYQMFKGEFKPINRDKYGRYCNMNQHNIVNYITSGKYKTICINYSDKNNFDKVKTAFDTILPSKSLFEK